MWSCWTWLERLKPFWFQISEIPLNIKHLSKLKCLDFTYICWSWPCRHVLCTKYQTFSCSRRSYVCNWCLVVPVHHSSFSFVSCISLTHEPASSTKNRFTRWELKGWLFSSKQWETPYFIQSFKCPYLKKAPPYPSQGAVDRQTFLYHSALSRWTNTLTLTNILSSLKVCLKEMIYSLSLSTFVVVHFRIYSWCL